MNMHYHRHFIAMGGLLCILLMSSPSLLTAQSIINVLERNPETTLFAAMIEKADLESRLNSNGPYTLFVPNNSALQQSGDRLSRNGARSMVLNHVLTGMATKRQIKAMSKAPSLGGLVLSIEVDADDNVIINNATVVRSNIRAQNGVIHIIDGTLD